MEVTTFVIWTFRAWLASIVIGLLVGLKLAPNWQVKAIVTTCALISALMANIIPL